MNYSLRIMGTRGIPARHGGFETFAERLALYLAGKGWQVTVYCQEDNGDRIFEDEWCGVRRVHIPVSQAGALGAIAFDWKSTLHAARENGLILSLGYGTALFCLLFRTKGITNLFNMDGLEWRRRKWSAPERAWLYMNERLACWLGNHLIADHPEIKAHLATRVSASKITMIPYGADRIGHAPADALAQYGLEAGKYALVVARPDPDNSILEVVRAFSCRSRGIKLVVLGNYNPDGVPYHKQVLAAAGDEVIFPGGIYDQEVVRALRFHALFYFHGHQVGGTNPSLVEAQGAGSPVLAHDNCFNRWVAGQNACYFTSEQECVQRIEELLSDKGRLENMRQGSRERHGSMFTWDKVLSQYESLLTWWQPHPVPRPAPTANQRPMTAIEPWRGVNDLSPLENAPYGEKS